MQLLKRKEEEKRIGKLKVFFFNMEKIRCNKKCNDLKSPAAEGVAMFN